MLFSKKSSIAEFRETTKKVIASSTEENIQPFKDTTKNFLEAAKKRIGKQIKKLDESKKVFMKTLRFYKYVPKSGTLDECTPGQFFEFWAPFTNDFRDIWKKEIATINSELYVYLIFIFTKKAQIFQT